MPLLSGGGFKMSPKSQKQGFELLSKLGCLWVTQKHMSEAPEALRQGWQLGSRCDTSELGPFRTT